MAVSNARLAHEYVEVLASGTSRARVTSEFIEVLSSGAGRAEILQLYAEVVAHALAVSRVCQIYAEVIGLGAVTGNGTNTIDFRLSRTVFNYEVGGRLSYAGGAGITAAVGGAVVSPHLGFPITNDSAQPPAAVNSATILANRTQLELKFNQAVTGFVPGANGFAMTGFSGGATTVTYLTGSGTDTVIMLIGREVVPGETGGVLSYTNGPIVRVANGSPISNFIGLPVVNGAVLVASAAATPPPATPPPAPAPAPEKGKEKPKDGWSWLRKRKSSDG